MDEMSILKELQPIFQDVFDDDSLVVTGETNAGMIEDWDSLAHIRLLVAIEKHFGIKFAFGELAGLKNVGEMLHVIQVKFEAKKDSLPS